MPFAQKLAKTEKRPGELYVQSCRDRQTTTSNSKLNISEENKTGYFGATQFVNWYNGHPEYQNLKPNFNTDSAIIIGNGNVAIDCARILVRTINELP